MKRTLLLLSVMAEMILLSTEPILVKNAGFEELNVKGYPVAWPNPSGGVWSSSSENVFEGKRSILYNNLKKGQYKFISQPVKVISGKRYEYSCMAKIIYKEKKTKSSPDIFMEFYNKGKYVGGNYSCDIMQTDTDWVQVFGSTKIPKGVDKVSLGLLVRPNGTADVKIWFDKVELKELEPRLFSGVLTTNCYRDQAFQGKVKVFCGIEEELYSVSAAKTIRLEVRQNGKTLFALFPEQVLPDRIIYSFDSGKLCAGKYELICSFKDPVTGKTDSVSQPFTKLAGKPAYKCYVDEHNRMILDGKPFFPLGMYFGVLTKNDIEIFSTTKMNCIMAYTPPGAVNRNYEKQKYLLDLLQKKNLYLFYSVKALISAKAFDDGTATRKTQAKGLATVNLVKGHPAIAAWYINDELSKTFVKDAIQYRRAIEEADPGRPTWSVLCQPDEFRLFTTASDIHGADPYPIPNKKPKLALQWTRAMQKSVMGTKMLIMVPQAFTWGRGWLNFGYPEKKCKECRRPSKEEIEAMSWMCIAGGANGLIYYSYFEQKMRDKQINGLPRIPFDVTFGEMRTITGHIMEYEKVLLSAGDPIPFKILKDGGSDIGIRAYEVDNTTWILAVNSDENESRELLLEMERNVTLQGTGISDAEVQIKGKTVSVTLKPLQALFIKLR